MADWKLNECFAHFGAAGANPRWNWSARSADGETVVITLWKDRITSNGREVTYHDFGIDAQSWQSRPGNRERLENLKWARDRCDGYFKTVITIAKDEAEQPRRIAECYPQPRFRMRVTELNETTGEFRAEHIPG